MVLSTWNPATELNSLRREMDNLFYQPNQLPVELNNAGDNLELKAQLPNINPDDLDVTVSRNSVSIRGEYQKSEKESYFSEFQYGKFSRSLTLPVNIQEEKVEADYNDGILTLVMPKIQQHTNKKVKVNVSDRDKFVSGFD